MQVSKAPTYSVLRKDEPRLTAEVAKVASMTLWGGSLWDNSIYSFNYLYCWMCSGTDVFLAFSHKVLHDRKDPFDQEELMHESANGTHR